MNTFRFRFLNCYNNSYSTFYLSIALVYVSTIAAVLPAIKAYPECVQTKTPSLRLVCSGSLYQQGKTHVNAFLLSTAALQNGYSKKT